MTSDERSILVRALAAAALARALQDVRALPLAPEAFSEEHSNNGRSEAA